MLEYRTSAAIAAISIALWVGNTLYSRWHHVFFPPTIDFRSEYAPLPQGQAPQGEARIDALPAPGVKVLPPGN